jgi:hypothetical protein
LPEPFYIGSGKNTLLKLEAMIYSDNLPAPQKVDLSINFEVDGQPPLTVEALKRMPPYPN